MKERVAIVLGTYNRLTNLRGAVESARRAVGDLKYEIIVSDGGSTDGSREWLAAQEDVVLFGQRGPLTGAVRAFNLGFGYAVDNAFDYVFHFNDDAEIVEHGIPAIRRAAELMLEDSTIGEVAFQFDLRGSYAFEQVHGKIYGNFGLIRTIAGIEVAKAQGDTNGRLWWNPIYRTYGADTEFGCFLWKLGWRIHQGIGLCVHDLNTQDALRAVNEANNPSRTDSKLFWSRWQNAGSLNSVKKNVNWIGAKIHLGCGTKKLRGWINVDALNCPAADVVMDFCDGMKTVPSGVVDTIYWSHGPEHVYPDRLPELMSNLRRILRPGGKLIVATIDLKGIYENRFLSSNNGSSWQSALYGETDSIDPIWAAHRQAFTHESLTTMLTKAGFADVRQWNHVENKEIADLKDYAVTCKLVTVCLCGIAPGAVAVEDGSELPETTVSVPEHAPVSVPSKKLYVTSAEVVRGGWLPGIAIVPEPGKLPPAMSVSRAERVLHVALRTPQERQPGLERALRSISSSYAEVEWVSQERAAPKLILDQARALKPTVVFMQLQRRTMITNDIIGQLRAVCDTDCVIINWDGDQHHEPCSAERKWFVELGQVCDTSLVVNTDHPATYAALGIKNPGYLQIGIDDEIYCYSPLDESSSNQASSPVAMLASNYDRIPSYNRRLTVATNLQAKLGSKFNVYGSGWDKKSWPKSGNPMVNQHKEAEIHSAAKASLSISIRNDLSRYTSDRLFRALASGACVVAERFPDMEGLGLSSDNCITWDSDPGRKGIVDVESMIRILADVSSKMSKEEYFRMRSNAANVGRTLHSWNSRMGDLLEIVRVVRSRKL